MLKALTLNSVLAPTATLLTSLDQRASKEVSLVTHSALIAVVADRALTHSDTAQTSLTPNKEEVSHPTHLVT